MGVNHHTKQWQGIVIALVLGTAVCLLCCLIGAGLISASVFEQKWDVVVSGISLGAGLLIAMGLLQRLTKLKKWVAILTAAGTALCLMLVGNLCLSQSDMKLLGCNGAVVAASCLLALLLFTRKKRAYRVKY